MWISTDSDLLGEATDLAIGHDGSLLVLDRLNARVLVLNHPGRVDLRFGRQGSGPGEFRNPRAIQANESGFDIIDAGNNRLQRLDAAGRYVAARQLPPFAANYPTALSAQGRIAVNTLADSMLIAVHDSANRRILQLVRSVAPMPGRVAIRAAQQEIRDGKVPGFFRNTVYPYFDPGGALWLAHAADGRVELWTAEGRLQASHELDIPEIRIIRAAFFDQYRNPSFQGLNALSFIADVHPVRSGVWVLLNGGEDDPTVVVRISSTGQLTRRWVLNAVRGARQLVVDETRGRVFFAIASTAEVVEVPLPS